MIPTVKAVIELSPIKIFVLSPILCAGVHGQRDPLGPGGRQAFKIVDSRIVVLKSKCHQLFSGALACGFSGEKGFDRGTFSLLLSLGEQRK